MVEPRLIPVIAYGTDELVSYALVDPGDWEWLMAHRWRMDQGGYAVRGKAIPMHRMVLGLNRGDGKVGDHINGHRLDNRRVNLRVLTSASNPQNMRSRPGSLSVYRGVTWHKQVGKWQAQVKVDGRVHYLGLFEDEEEANRIACRFRAENMPYSYEASVRS